MESETVVHVVMPVLARLDSGEDFQFPRAVVQLFVPQDSGAKGDWLQAVAVVLQENGADCRRRGVSDDGVRQERVCDEENGCGSDETLDVVERALHHVRPGVLSSFASEGVERLSLLGETFAEFAQQSGEAKETAELSRIGGAGHIGDGFNGIRIRLNAVVGDDMTEVLDLQREEATLPDVDAEFLLG